MKFNLNENKIQRNNGLLYIHNNIYNKYLFRSIYLFIFVKTFNDKIKNVYDNTRQYRK